VGAFVPKVKEPQTEENKIKISLKEMPTQDKKSGLTKEKVKDPKIAPPMPKGSQLKNIEKKPPIKYEPQKQPVKEPKLNQPPKTNPKPIKEPRQAEKQYISLNEPMKEQNLTKKQEEKKPENKLYELLLEDKSAQQETKQTQQSKNASSINQSISELYGDEFGKLSSGQQKYILDNQEIMRRITQQVLNRVASVNISKNLNVNRSNVIEFYLHPNGDMTDFRFLQKSGYYTLDDTTRETIEYAYSRYPRPTEKTLIRYNVFYNLSSQ